MDVTPNPKAASAKSSSPLEGMRRFFDEDAIKHMFDGIQVSFPSFKHDHPAAIDVNRVADERMSLGQKVADKVAETMGSWPFIITQSIILILWITLNLVGWFYHWDQYPFIFLNLALSCQAAYAAPIIMMSQNRQAEKDRLTAQNDYQTDMKGEQEVRFIMEHLDHQDTVILQLLDRIEVQHQQLLLRLSKLDPELAKQLVSDLNQLTGDEAES